MGFKVSARTVLQLGGELISSDGIAFYELIKNAFDAGSSKVKVDIVVRLPVSVVESCLRTLAASHESDNRDETAEEAAEAAVESVMAQIEEHVDRAAPNATSWLRKVAEATDVDALAELVADANTIQFEDFGHGMSLEDLTHYYLTIGTPHRKIQRTSGETNLLGEKGIGRLSTMRLGRNLFVQTATEGDQCWNLLDIDWTAFEEDATQLLEDVAVEPWQGNRIAEDEERGTLISISRLNEDWTFRSVSTIATNDIARLLDPFRTKRRITVLLKHNGQRVPVPRMSKILTENAHATVTASFDVTADGGRSEITLSGEVEYLISSAAKHRLRGRVRKFAHSFDDLCGMLADEELTLEACVGLGPFSLVCYWWNRRIIKKITINDEQLDLKSLVRQWSGGLALYRDGFRVPPYGGPDDDWLDLDRGAFGAKAYKVNRAQLVGKVDISSRANPFLVDQTNREGLRDCRESRALAALCRFVLERELRAYLTAVDEELRESGENKVDFGALAEELAEVEEAINSSLDELASTDGEHPSLGLKRVERRLRSAYTSVVGVVEQMQSTVDATEDEKTKLLHLAALGLSVEKLAHELNRATRHALDAIHAPESELSRESARLQLQSLQKRLQNLDPQLGPKRNRKETFDLRDCLEMAVSSYAAKAERHGVDICLDVTPDKPITLHTVKACVIQVVQNLLDNSFYWITARRRTRDVVDKQRAIAIRVRPRRNHIEVWDNGPGIAPENRERVFREFFTLRRRERGNGLGLYIARELLDLYGGTIELVDKDLNENGRLSTFVIDYSGMMA